MFDFEKFTVYKKAELFNTKILKFLKASEIDIFLKDQLKRASISIVLNIAEGAGRFSKKDKKNFYVMARGSVFECVSILRLIRNAGKISDKNFLILYKDLEELSKMLYGLIKTMLK